MPSVEKDPQSLETLYLALESRLESQYQDLLAHRFSDSDGKASAEGLERHLREAEKLLTGFLSSRSTSSPALASACLSAATDMDSLRKRVQHLLELVNRNATLCAQLRSSANSGLQELQRGEQFLQGMRGYRENQPRFFDSCQ